MIDWQAIVFDLDDTLFPEREYVLGGMRAVAAWAQGQFALPRDRTFAELHELFEQGVRGDTFNRWLQSHGRRPDDWVPAMVQVYRRHDPRIAPYAEVRNLLEDLAGQLRLGLVTDGYLAVQQRKVAALGLGRYFAAIVYSDALGRRAWKPSPRPFETVLEQLDVAAAEAVYVGDNPAKDFRGARSVGMQTIRVRRPDGLHRQLEPSCPEDAPDVEITDLGRLRTMLIDRRATGVSRPLTSSERR